MAFGAGLPTPPWGLTEGLPLSSWAVGARAFVLVIAHSGGALRPAPNTALPRLGRSKKMHGTTEGTDHTEGREWEHPISVFFRAFRG